MKGWLEVKIKNAQNENLHLAIIQVSTIAFVIDDTDDKITLITTIDDPEALITKESFVSVIAKIKAATVE